MEFGLLDGGGDGEHNGVGFVDIFEIYATQDAFFFGMDAFSRVVGIGWLIGVKPVVSVVAMSCVMFVELRMNYTSCSHATCPQWPLSYSGWLATYSHSFHTLRTAIAPSIPKLNFTCMAVASNIMAYVIPISFHLSYGCQASEMWSEPGNVWNIHSKFVLLLFLHWMLTFWKFGKWGQYKIKLQLLARAMWEMLSSGRVHWSWVDYLECWGYWVQKGENCSCRKVKCAFHRIKGQMCFPQDN